MRPIAKNVLTTGIEPGRTRTAGLILVNLIVHLRKQYKEQYAILPSIDISFPNQDFTCDLGIFPPRKIDWLNDLPRVEPPISAFEIVIPTETAEQLTDAIRTYYFPNGVKSAWIIAPNQQSITLIQPEGSTQVFTQGIVCDSATGLTVSVEEIFAD